MCHCNRKKVHLLRTTLDALGVSCAECVVTDTAEAADVARARFDFLSRHRPKHVHCAGKGVPVLKFEYRHAHIRAMDMPTANHRGARTDPEGRHRDLPADERLGNKRDRRVQLVHGDESSEYLAKHEVVLTYC